MFKRTFWNNSTTVTLSFAKNMGKKVGKSTRKNVSGNCSQNFTDHARQFAADALKTNSKIIIHKTAERTGDLIGVNIADRINKVSKNSH